MENQKTLQQIVERECWFNFKYSIISDPKELRSNYIPHGNVISHPVLMNMTIDQFCKAEKKLKTLNMFLELDSYKLESPRYNSESGFKETVNDISLSIKEND